MKSTIKKTMLDHPFFDYASKRGILLSEEESAHILSTAHPSFMEMVETAKTRFADENVPWEAFDAAIAAQENMTYKQSRSALSRPVRSIRLTAAALAFIFILAFFMFAPTGRTMAVNLFDIVIDIFGDQVKLINRSKEGFGNSAIWDNGETREYVSFDAFREETGFTPFVLQTDWIKSVEITCTFKDGSGYSLSSDYTTSSGHAVHTNQIWGTTEDLVIKNEGGSFDQSTIRDNYTMYYAVDKTDGKFAGIVLLNHSVLQISADAEIGMYDMLAVLQ
jgi:hypothetical protein